MKIVTQYVFPPIPIRQFDWAATFGDPDEGCAVGYGRTEAEAIADLKEQVETCRDCGGLVNDDGMTIDPDTCCFTCKAD